MFKVMTVLDKPKTLRPVSNATVQVFLLRHIRQVAAVQSPHPGDGVGEVSQASTMIVPVDDVAAIFSYHGKTDVHSAPVAVHVSHIAISPQVAVFDVFPAKIGQVQIVAKFWNHLAKVGTVGPYPFLQPVFVVAFNKDFLATVRQSVRHLVKPFPRVCAIVSNRSLAARIFVEPRQLVEIQQVAQANENVRLNSAADADQSLHAGLAFVGNVNIRTNKHCFHKSPRSEYHGHSLQRCA